MAAPVQAGCVRTEAALAPPKARAADGSPCTGGAMDAKAAPPEGMLRTQRLPFYGIMMI